MKLKLSLVFAALVALTATVAASAKPPAPATGACKPTVSFILKGTFAAADAGGGFTMNVTAANKHARQFKGQNGLLVSVDAKTKFRRNGPAQLPDLVAGDRLLVQVRACKNAFAPQPAADPNAPAAPAAAMLLAKRVVAHPAQAASSDDSTSSGSPTSP